MEIIIIFILGCVFGSAANALIDRLPTKKSWIKGRSRCDECGHELNWQDLIPIFSYLTLRGKCRYCHSPIPARNLLVELLVGISFVIFNIQNSIFNISTIVLMGIFWVTVIIAVMDWETRLVSEVMIVVWGGLVVLLSLSNLSILSNLGGVALGVGIIGGIWLVTRGRAMGDGDIEIAAVMGWWLSWERTLVAIWLAFVLGAIAGVYQIARHKAGMKSEIAFGPFLIVGTWMAFFWGEKLWGYLGFG